MLKQPKPNQITQSHKPHEKMLGKRSAGNPHAAFEVAGAGNEFQDEQFLSMHKIAGRILESVEITRQLSTLLKYAAKTSEADMAKIARSYQAIGDAYEVVNQYNWDEQQLIAYEQEKKRIWDNIAALNYQLDRAEAKGLAKGKAEGKTERNIEIATNLLSQNIDHQVISDATGLSIEEIKSLE